jgi:hypothetical protein
MRCDSRVIYNTASNVCENNSCLVFKSPTSSEKRSLMKVSTTITTSSKTLLSGWERTLLVLPALAGWG